MDDQKRGVDAADQAPKPSPDKAPKDVKTTAEPQDAANYDERTDGGRAIPGQDISSANDE